MKTKNALIVFIKTPAPFQVKTRLQPQLSGKQSALLYTAFLRDIDKKLSKAKEFDCWYAIAPENYDINYLKDIIDMTNFFQQQGRDLGERMDRAFRELFSKEYKKIILVGSDIPTVPVDYIQQAFTAIEKDDVVIGPCTDGGYYLIGLHQPYSRLFSDLAWSTSEVLKNTMSIIKENKLSVSSLPQQPDIDTFSDLVELYQSLRKADQETTDFPSYSWAVISDIFSKINLRDRQTIIQNNKRKANE
jgi:rSAM/selenodomain-associated transferase 1